MKVFYTTSSAFFNEHKDKYDKTLKVIERLSGEKPLMYSDKVNRELNYESNIDEIRKLVFDAEKALKNSDVVIADITISTAGTGYDIATALNLKKPVLVLKREDDKTPRGAHTITVKKSKLLSYMRYNDENLEKVISKFLNKSKQLIDNKFILIIPPEIDRYLEWASDYRRMRKAQVVREAVSTTMKRDREWNEMNEEEDEKMVF